MSAKFLKVSFDKSSYTITGPESLTKIIPNFCLTTDNSCISRTSATFEHNTNFIFPRQKKKKKAPVFARHTFSLLLKLTHTYMHSFHPLTVRLPNSLTKCTSSTILLPVSSPKFLTTTTSPLHPRTSTGSLFNDASSQKSSSSPTTPSIARLPPT